METHVMQSEGIDPRLLHYYTGPSLFKSRRRTTTSSGERTSTCQEVVRALTGAPLFKSAQQSSCGNRGQSGAAMRREGMNRRRRTCANLHDQTNVDGDLNQWLPRGLLVEHHTTDDQHPSRPMLRKTTSWNSNAFSSYFDRASPPTPSPSSSSLMSQQLCSTSMSSVSEKSSTLAMPFSLFPKSSDSDILSSVRNELMDKKWSKHTEEKMASASVDEGALGGVDNSTWLEDALQGLQIGEMKKTSRKF